MAICVLVGRVLRPLFPHRPLWATTFTKEFVGTEVMASPDSKKRLARSANVLLLNFLAGLVLHLVTMFYPYLKISLVAQAISWVIGVPESKNPVDLKARPYSSFLLRLIVPKPLLLAYLQLLLPLYQHS